MRRASHGIQVGQRMVLFSSTWCISARTGIIVPFFVILFLLFLSLPATAAGYRGLTIETAIERLEQDGLSILYSSELVKPWMRVREEPSGDDARALLEQMLVPYQLALRDGPESSVLIVRGDPPSSGRGGLEGGSSVAAITQTASLGTDLTELIVTASQYELVRGAGVPPVSMSAADLEFIPNPGDDPMRAVARLPGVASADITAKANIRGGEVDEMLVRFDGLRLYNPFHLKDFKSVFSAIDPGITQQMDIYTGGFPSTYGDRMSSVIDVASLPASDGPQREIALSFFNVSAMAKDSFNDGKGDWLVSVRRGTLDLFLDVASPKLGDPTYVDVYTRVGYWFTDAFGVSANFLLFDDDIKIFDSDQEEAAQADYRDEYYWFRFDLAPGERLSGNVIWARTELDSKRNGETDQPGVAVGTLSDMREFSIDSLQTDWSWRALDRLNFSLGATASSADGRYRYEDEADFALLFLTPGATRDPSRKVRYSTDVDGEYYGLYMNARWQATTSLAAEAGLRWDKETVSAGDPDEVSPRIALLYSFGAATDLRASWGRYYQAQAINELQLSDGVTSFSAPQRSDHIVLGLDHRFRGDINLRLELYHKDYDKLRVRYENFLNPLVLLPELKPDRVRIAPDSSRAKGLEATLRQSGQGPWNWWLSYAWASVKDEFGDIEIRRSWDQTHSLGLGLGWRSARWEFSVAGNYRTGWPTSATELAIDDPFPLVSVGPRNEERLGNYAAVDARVARHWQFSESHSLSVFVEVNNLFNRENDCCIEYEVDDDDGELILDTQPVNAMTIIPSAGFVWRF